MKEFLANNAFGIGTLFCGAVGAYFTLKANTAEIAELQAKIVEIETNKVSKSELALKEQFAATQMNTIKSDINHIDQRLDKKIKVVNELAEDVSCISETTAVQEERIAQGERERSNLWKFTNKFLEEL